MTSLSARALIRLFASAHIGGERTATAPDVVKRPIRPAAILGYDARRYEGNLAIRSTRSQPDAEFLGDSATLKTRANHHAEQHHATIAAICRARAARSRGRHGER